MIHRIGRRGAFLIANGALFAGYGLALENISHQAGRQASYAVATSVAPLVAWAALWAVAGLAAVLSGLTGRGQPLAFAGIMALALLWAASFLLAQPVFEAPERTWVGGLLFGSLVASIAVVSGWPEAKR